MVREFSGYRISIYSPNDHFAVITGPGSNAVIELKENQPRATVVEGASVCLNRAEKLIENTFVASVPSPTILQ